MFIGDELLAGDEDSDDEIYDDPPDPTTIEGLTRLVAEVEQMFARWNWEFVPETARAAQRYHKAAVQAPGYEPLAAYIKTHLRQYVTTKSLNRLACCLARARQQGRYETGRLTLVEAVEILTSGDGSPPGC